MKDHENLAVKDYENLTEEEQCEVWIEAIDAAIESLNSPLVIIKDGKATFT